MDFATIQSALEAWVQVGTQIDATQIRFADREQNRTTPGVCAQLAIGPTSAIGVDDLRWTDTDPGGDGGVFPTVNGYRVFTFSVKITTRNAKPDNTGTTGRKARHYAERLRTSLCLPSVARSFQAAQLAVVRSMDVVDFPAVSGGRAKSTAHLDVMFATTSILADAVDDYFNKLRVSSTLKGEDGADLPASLQLDEMEI